jgi:hypothetical protein
MNRNIYTILILFLLQSLSLFSQTYIGAAGGLMSSSLSGDAPQDASYSSKTGLSGGLVVDFTLTEDVVLSIQPRYLQKGSTIAYDVGEYELRDSLTATLDYVSIPIMVKINSLNKRIYFSTGLDFGYLMNSSVENIMDGSTKDVNNLIKSYDISATFGFGVNIPIGSPIISLELRYMQSILNLSDISSTESGTTFPYRFRTSGFQFLTSILFPI